jgi:hypothetical protein
MHATSHAIDITTDASGDATVYTPNDVNGRIFQIQYVKDDFDDGSTITLTGTSTGVPVFAITGMNASATHQVRRKSTDAAAVANGTGSVSDSGGYVTITDTNQFDAAVAGMFVICDFADDDHADGRYEISSVSSNDAVTIDLSYVSGTEDVNWTLDGIYSEHEFIALAGERIKCVVSGGGNKTNGALAIISG